MFTFKFFISTVRTSIFSVSLRGLEESLIASMFSSSWKGLDDSSWTGFEDSSIEGLSFSTGVPKTWHFMIANQFVLLCQQEELKIIMHKEGRSCVFVFIVFIVIYSTKDIPKLFSSRNGSSPESCKQLREGSTIVLNYTSNN